MTFPELFDKLTWEEDEGGRSSGMELIRFSKVMARHISMDGKWEVVRASQSLSSGRHYFEVEFIEEDLDMAGVYERYSQSDIILVGVVGANFKMNHKNLRIGNPQKGWAYGSRGGTDLNPAYGEPFGPGDTIGGVEVDMNVGTVEFWKNGQSQGLAYVDVKGPVFPAVGLFLQSPQVESSPRTFPSSKNPATSGGLTTYYNSTTHLKPSLTRKKRSLSVWFFRWRKGATTTAQREQRYGPKSSGP